MKKIFSFAFALAVSVYAMAVDPAYVEIELTGETGGSSSVYLYEDNAYTNAYESGADVEKFMSFSNSKSVLMYGIVGSYKCEDVVTNNLDGQVLGFATNQTDENYTLHFIDFEGRTLKLYDRVEDQEIVITDGGTYGFSVNPSLVGQHEINDRFIINFNPAIYPASVTTGQDGWASFAFGEDLVPALPAGLTIYKGDFNDDLANPEIALTAVANIPAGAGVFVHGAANTTYYFSNALSTLSPLADNDIVGCVNETAVSTFSGKDIYTLRYANGETALWHYTGSDIPAGKAVLPIINAGGPTTAPKRVRMVINQTTGVENVETIAPAEKFFEDGQVLIKRGNEVYNLQGQMVR